MDAFIDWIVSTRLSWFVTEYRWVWPISESLHFCGLTLLAGTVGLFDLRVLGFVKGIAPSTLHATLPWGLAGFVASRHHRRDVHLRHAGSVLLQRRVPAQGRVPGADGRERRPLLSARVRRGPHARARTTMRRAARRSSLPLRSCFSSASCCAAE